MTAFAFRNRDIGKGRATGDRPDSGTTKISWSTSQLDWLYAGDGPVRRVCFWRSQPDPIRSQGGRPQRVVEHPLQWTQRDVGVDERGSTEATARQDVHVGADVEGEQIALVADVARSVRQMELALGLFGGAGEVTWVQLSAPLQEATAWPARASRDAAMAPP